MQGNRTELYGYISISLGWLFSLFLPSCDDDYFCGWNCGKCSEPEFCSSCGCTSSLGCARNCAKCGGDFGQPAGESSLLLSVSKYINKWQLFISRFSARVCGLLWSCRGLSLHLPFHLRGSQIRGLCSSQRVGLSDLFDFQKLNRHCRGLSNLYSSLYWCSTKVDINGFHIRGPYNNKGVCTCQFWIFLIIIVITEICWILWRHLSENHRNLLLDLIEWIEWIE